jgi:hypothetical protein
MFKCLLKKTLGPLLKCGVLSTSKDWAGKGSYEPSWPIGWSKPKEKAVFKRKAKLGLGLGMGQAAFKSDPKGKTLSSMILMTFRARLVRG